MPKFKIEHFAFEDEPTPDGLGFFVHEKNLFHTPRHPSQPISAKSSLYFVPEEKIAIHYAKTKFSPIHPVIASVKIQNLKLLDFRNKENLKVFLVGFRNHLSFRLENEKLNWLEEIAVKTALENTNPAQVSKGHVTELIDSLGMNFKSYCKSLGYDGLIAYDGGEKVGINHHDTYLIFDPNQIRILKEKILKS